MIDDSTNIIRFEPTWSCTAKETTPYLLLWCKTMGVLRVSMSDTASHFKNRALAKLKEALKIDNHFAVA